MSKNRNQNILLVEIMIAVLFFALCSGVMLETFVAAREYERRARIETEALVGMQNITEQVYAAGSAEETLEALGFEADGGVWTMDTGDFIYEMTVTQEPAPAGTLRTTLIRALRNGEAIAEIPGARYLPGGDVE